MNSLGSMTHAYRVHMASVGLNPPPAKFTLVVGIIMGIGMAIYRISPANGARVNPYRSTERSGGISPTGVPPHQILHAFSTKWSGRLHLVELILFGKIKPNHQGLAKEG